MAKTKETSRLAGFNEGDTVQLNKTYYKVIKENGKLVLRKARVSSDFSGVGAIEYSADGRHYWKDGLKIEAPKGYTSKIHKVKPGSSAYTQLQGQLVNQNLTVQNREYSNITNTQVYKKFVSHVERRGLSDKDLLGFYTKMFGKDGSVRNVQNLTGDRSMFQRALAARKVLENRGYSLGDGTTTFERKVNKNTGEVILAKSPNNLKITNNESQPNPNNVRIETLGADSKDQPQPQPEPQPKAPYNNFEQNLAQNLQGVRQRDFRQRDEVTLTTLGIGEGDLRTMGVSKFDQGEFLRGVRTGRNRLTTQGTIIRTPNVRGPTQVLKIPQKQA